jgi:hypothetical protein
MLRKESFTGKKGVIKKSNGARNVQDVVAH